MTPPAAIVVAGSHVSGSAAASAASFVDASLAPPSVPVGGDPSADGAIAPSAGSDAPGASLHAARATAPITHTSPNPVANVERTMIAFSPLVGAAR